MNENEALDSLLAQAKTLEEFLKRLRDGKTVVCSMCTQIERLRGLYPAKAEELIIAQRRVQEAYYGVDEKGQPKLPHAISLVKKNKI